MPNFTLAAHIKTPHSKEKRKARDSKKMNTDQYRQDMSNIDISTTLYEAKCINKVYNEYQEKALRVIDKHAPYKFFSRKEMRWKLRPWLTKGIQNSIKN